MATIRELINKLESHLVDIDGEELDNELRLASAILEDIISKVDDIEASNNKIEVIVNDLNKSDYMSEVVNDLTDPMEEIGRIVY